MRKGIKRKYDSISLLIFVRVVMEVFVTVMIERGAMELNQFTGWKISFEKLKKLDPILVQTLWPLTVFGKAVSTTF